MKKLMMAMAVPALMIGCSEQPDQKKISDSNLQGLTWKQTANLISIRTFDDQPLAGAQILIGDALNSPFAGNFLTTDKSGDVSIPEGWDSALPITVQAEGYLRTTYMAQQPGPITIKLRPLATRTQLEVKGLTSGLPVKNKDGYIDFGLVMPAFSRADMLTFDINNFISPQSDRISALGQDIDIPANISLPKQSEKYGLFTVNLEKPVYRIYFGHPGVNRVFAARGRFPFKSTVDSLRGGAEFYQLVNTIALNGGAIRDINVGSGNNRLDMPTQEINFTEKREVKAPAYRGDENFMAVGVSNQSGYFIPTDVKKVAGGKKMALNIQSGAQNLVLGVLKKTAEMEPGSRLSATLIPFTSQAAPQMLPLIANPTLHNDELLMPKFNTIDGVNPIATYSILSKEEEVQQGPSKVKILNPKWEVYSQNWIERMKLPQWPQDLAVNGKKRWEVNFLGSQTTSQVVLGPAMIEATTHVTQSSVSF